MTHHHSLARAGWVALLALTTTTATFVLAGGPAAAEIVPTVGLGTAADFGVLGSTTVTNTNTPTIVEGSLGVSPGTAITNFPPGVVVPPGTIHAGDAVSALARDHLTAAYLDAEARPVTTPLTTATVAELGGLVLGPGVYAEGAKAPLGLTGTLTLDGENNLNAVFIFQTDSELTTASASRVELINGAQECNVFWQVGSSATLGTGSVFAGNLLALTSISVASGVTVHGRALARNGAVTLDNDTFTRPTCAQAAQVTTTTTLAGSTTTLPGDATTTTFLAGAPTTFPGGAPTTVPGDSSTALTPGAPGPEVPRVVGPPRTGAAPLDRRGSLPWPGMGAAGLLLAAVAVAAARHRREDRRPAPPAAG